MNARFDDLRPDRRRSFGLTDPIAILEARTVGEVTDTIAAAEDAVNRGRWVAGFVCYEAAPAFDHALAVFDPPDTAGLPLAWFAVYGKRAPTTESRPGTYELGEWQPTVDAGNHHDAVNRIREHIRQGETYQVNHTFRLDAPFDGDAAALYQHLTEAQTCGYGAFLDVGRWAVASASPELFFEWRHGRLVSKPMKGTVRRGTTLADDEDKRRFLQTSEKNRAENLMIVDMVRNDLGRVCITGSVRVPELFSTEKYDTVWQMTSTVVGTPRSDVALVDVFGALFPSASITGAPKVATMQIISRLETTSRGVYCGAIGFGGPGPGGPEWAFNVGIRTVLVDRDRARATYGTGGGITYDSTPGDEYSEALLKTRVLDRRSASLSILETMRWDPDEGFYELVRHLERLSSSAWYFDIPLDPAEVRAGLDRAVASSSEPLAVRLLVDRVGWITVETGPIPPATGSPIRLALDSTPVDPTDPLLHHKTTNRSIYERAAERHPDADDVVLVNSHGHVTETTVGNIAAEIDGAWLTPPLSHGVLPGIRRAATIEAGEIRERPITPTQLAAATRLARLNALRGCEPARLIV